LKKPRGTNLNGEPTAWELRLELVGNYKERLGRLVVKRKHANRPLLLDVNLLTLDFQEVLAKATVRAMIPGSQRNPEPERDSYGRDGPDRWREWAGCRL
jgi:hypothetical protein